MATFKYKPDKVKYLNIVQTLDETHQKYANEFSENRTNIDNKIEDLKNFKLELKKIDSDNSLEITNEIIKQKSKLKDSIKKLEKEIAQIKKGTNEIEYYCKTGDILMDYYNLLEDDSNDGDSSKDNNIKIIEDVPTANNSHEKLQRINKTSQSLRKEKKPTKKRLNAEDINKNTSKNILNFFSKKTEQESETSNTNITDTNNDIEKVVSNRASLFDLYMSIIDKKYASDKLKINIIRMCTVCNIEKSFRQSEGRYVCTKCGESEHVIVEPEIPNHKDSGNEKPRTPYKKQTHLTETMNQFQAKESTQIPPRVYRGIDIELKKRKITIEELSKMKYPKAKILIKEILKKLRFSSFYEHVPFILSKITNKPAPTISREIEELIKKMFKKTEGPFKKHCPKDRKNYINYSYIFNKIFGILEMPEYADCFPLLKSPDKLKKADILWEKICIDNDWLFEASI